ncbi:hypothetical protein Acr_12g0007260 [Actinidia rufa]|uniref:Phorbol-ester/DAG-type domain-containing protein n=1 Tax=Actinidia rufa TaxID=165716 RepID=A0A7J0FHK9_9ERIC|nr:hypothetical protein Acr_12g0007260 [Actinidia rufa]
MEHFSHEHPLIILDEVPKRDRVRAYCGGCGFPIDSGPFYRCEQCRYDLHKFCAELPHEMKHPWHPEHPLTLDTVSLDYSCKACNFNRRGSLAYQCEPSSFCCHACGKEHEGVSYKCTRCQFWVHESCASMPSSIKHSDHHHPLTRAYTLERFGSFIFCGICQKDMKIRDWDEETKNEDVLDPNVILLPGPDESIHLITSFVERTHGEVIKMEKQLNHLGHHHTLTLFDEQIKDELFSGSKDNLCEACVKPIFAPFYGCTPCKYFLHKCCAELPTQIQHPFHPNHPLDLLTKAPKDFGLFLCRCCDNLCNGFSFKCAKCKDFYLDVKCGSLSGPIKHESHKHVLTPKIMSRYDYNYACEYDYDYCRACPSDLLFRDRVFTCDMCEFIMHAKCVMLPTSLKHKYDEHPFILTYSPIKNHPNEYYCEICEEEMNPRYWFYNCVECDQSIHRRCMHDQDQYSNVKFGAYFEVEGHQHPLTFIQFSNEYGSLCNHCGKRLHEDKSLHPGFECKPCEFKLHLECARDAAKKE